MIKSVVWASMLDYPSHVCTSIFFGECNFDCEFCHNQSMKKLKNIDFEKEVLPKLLERKEFLDYVILSGGECTYSKNIQKIIDILFENGFNIGLHTNGTTPEFLKKNINKIKFIGMDVKNDLDNYDEICRVKVDTDKIKESIDFIIKSGIQYEFRTTVYPKYIDIMNCIHIAKYLKEQGAEEYVIQQYNKIEGLDIEPYNEEKLITIKNECSKYIDTRLK